MRGNQRGLPTRNGRNTVTNDNNLARPSELPVLTGRAQRIIESRELFGTENEILISHDGAIYRMKITRQGKLILNK
ncbi:hemin uptake protein HemP [Ensifer sp. KUDG1]|jgi:hemin uptake protein HemP|nr:hemin uptake protein HemP [Ensifer sp. ENS09]MBD9648202.1 hemin uptake protein HemP [Ensifer sp. ENS09]NUS67739.1 hemin uptake protein HemP [Ensifer adhaerens]